MDVVAEIVMVPIDKIVPYDDNPRLNQPTIDKLVELIPKVGFNVPLVLDPDNVIVKGHSRWQAARRLGLARLPCVYSAADPETIRLDRLADNRVQQFSTWDKELLQSELGALNLDFEFDLASLDFRVTVPPAVARAATPAAAAGGAADAEPFIDQADVAATVGGAGPGEFIEVACEHCGQPIFVRLG